MEISHYFSSGDFIFAATIDIVWWQWQLVTFVWQQVISVRFNTRYVVSLVRCESGVSRVLLGCFFKEISTLANYDIYGQGINAMTWISVFLHFYYTSLHYFNSEHCALDLLRSLKKSPSKINYTVLLSESAGNESSRLAEPLRSDHSCYKAAVWRQ